MLKCARTASLKGVCDLNWRMMGGKLFYSNSVLLFLFFRHYNIRYLCKEHPKINDPTNLQHEPCIEEKRVLIKKYWHFLLSSYYPSFSETTVIVTELVTS